VARTIQCTALELRDVTLSMISLIGRLYPTLLSGSPFFFSFF
jgi:hypothetical protein